MPKTITIKLETDIIGHKGAISDIIIREPLARDFFELGEPFAYARNPDGTIYTAENSETIKSYIERLVEEPDTLLLGQLSLFDAMQVKAAVIGFFTATRARL